jgi:hypothetical protein
MPATVSAVTGNADEVVSVPSHFVTEPCELERFCYGEVAFCDPRPMRSGTRLQLTPIVGFKCNLDES